MVESFLSRFAIMSESSIHEHVDMVLVLKSIPGVIKNFELRRVELFHFKIFQESLIAYQN